MFVGNNCYVTECYNQQKFQLLLEQHLNGRKSIQIDRGLIEYAISAMLTCIEKKTILEDVCTMEKYLYSMDITYSDHRSYSESSIVENPEDAVKVFNRLASKLSHK